MVTITLSPIEVLLFMVAFVLLLAFLIHDYFLADRDASRLAKQQVQIEDLTRAGRSATVGALMYKVRSRALENRLSRLSTAAAAFRTESNALTAHRLDDQIREAERMLLTHRRQG
jgi:hypothetical protein